MNCPKDGYELEFTSGNFWSGVSAPDGTKEMLYEEGFQCPRCGTIWDESDLSKEDEDVSASSVPE